MSDGWQNETKCQECGEWTRASSSDIGLVRTRESRHRRDCKLCPFVFFGSPEADLVIISTPVAAGDT